MNTVTYTDIAERHGRDQADALLKNMEQLAHLPDENDGFDREVRFQRALDALCATNFS